MRLPLLIPLILVVSSTGGEAIEDPRGQAPADSPKDLLLEASGHARAPLAVPYPAGHQEGLLLKIALELADLGDTETLAEVIEGLHDAYGKAAGLARIAVAQANAGDAAASAASFERAVQLAERLTGGRPRGVRTVSALGRISTAKAEAGDRAGAEALRQVAIQRCAQFPDPENRYRAYEGLAYQRALAGDLSGAIQEYDTLKPMIASLQSDWDFHRNGFLRYLARLLIERRRLADVARVIDLIPGAGFAVLLHEDLA